jgi:serine/threonine protein phosphatase PrpC
MSGGNYLLASSHEEMNPNRRHTMEDVHRIVPCLCGDQTLSYFAVYDGHGGAVTPFPPPDRSPS